MMKIELIKTHKDAVLPTCNNKNGVRSDSGYDLYAVEDVLIPRKGSEVVAVGLQVGYIEPGYWFKIEARSGLSFKHQILPHPGIIDNMYRGDLGVLLFNHSNLGYNVKKGDRIAQIIIYQVIQADIQFTEQIDPTKRGTKGFGSSGK